MRIIHVNESDIGGGAARAAYRIHRSLIEHGRELGLQSCMRVVSQGSDDPTVVSGMLPLWKHIQPYLAKQVRKGLRTDNSVLHSVAWPDTGLGLKLQQVHKWGQGDILHLHWLGDSTLSIEEIGRLSAPLVWTLHDQWAFCGAEHYTSPPKPGETDSHDRRFVVGYSSASRPTHERGLDINRRTWRRKQRAWRKPIQIVCPSHWLADCVRRSALMGTWPVTVIPNPLDLNRWAPVEQAQARQLLNLPLDRPLVLFGAMGGTNDPRKGSDLLFLALQILKSQLISSELGNLELLVFGQGTPTHPPDLGFPVHYMGRLQDDISLRLLYAAADVFILPSRQDNLPNTGLESQACGTPVVAFRTGGLTDVVEDRVTGALADPFDPHSLAAAVLWVLDGCSRRHALGGAARQRAERLWSPKRITKSYLGVYEEAILLSQREKNCISYI